MTLTLTTQIVLFCTNVPGDPNNTIPPSVGLLIMLFCTREFWHATLIPSAHC